MMARKSKSGGCGCGKPKCSGCNKYRAGGMVRKYAVGGPVEGDPRKEALAAIASMVAADNAAQESGTMTAPGSEKSTDVVMPGVAAAVRAIEGYEKPPEDAPMPMRSIGPRSVRQDLARMLMGARKKEQPRNKADFSGGEGNIQFNPIFSRDTVQSGFRGPGNDIQGGFKGVQTSLMEDGYMKDKDQLMLSDVPEFMEDPYFAELVGSLNKNFGNLSNEEFGKGKEKAAKSPEAQMLARIMGGQITLEEAKRQAGYQPRISASF